MEYTKDDIVPIGINKGKKFKELDLQYVRNLYSRLHAKPKLNKIDRAVWNYCIQRIEEEETVKDCMFLDGNNCNCETHCMKYECNTF